NRVQLAGFRETIMKLHSSSRVLLVCLLALTPRPAQAQAAQGSTALPLKIDDVIVVDQESRPPPFLDDTAARARAQDFPNGFLQSAPAWPAGVPTSAGLASDSVGTEPGGAPEALPVPQVDPIAEEHEFWANKSHYVQRCCLFVRRAWD